VTLNALDRQVAGERTAAAVLDHVAQRINRGRLPDDAEIEHLAACLEVFDNDDGAVGGIAFFIGGEQEGQRSGMVRVGGEKVSTAVTAAAIEDFMSAAPRP
jgi:hypothetical protein